jgi:hypothetical protein
MWVEDTLEEDARIIVYADFSGEWWLARGA